MPGRTSSGRTAVQSLQPATTQPSFHFLGYDPSLAPQTLTEQVVHRRRELGLTIELAAKLAAVDAGTFARLERGQANSVKSTAAAKRFLALMPGELGLGSTTRSGE